MTRFIPEQSVTLKVLGILLVTFAVYQNLWVIDSRGFFMADDWGALHAAQFRPWDRLYNFTLLPRTFYLDRPVGIFVIKVAYDLFGINYSAFGFVWLLLHLLNCCLIFLFTRHYLSTSGAFAVSVLSCVWFSANTALGWFAAVNDVICATFCLATLVLHQSAIRRRSLILFTAQVFAHILAIRSKEIALGLVIPLFLTGILLERLKIRETLRVNIPNILLTMLYVVQYLSVRVNESFNSDGFVYSLHLSPTIVITNILKYSRMLLFVDRYFSIPVGSINIYFDKWYITFSVMIAIFVALLVTTFRERWNILLFAAVTYLVTMGPLLLLKSQFSELYLYAPHFFFAIICCIGIGASKRRAVILSYLLVGLILILQTYGSFRTKQTRIHFERTEIARKQFDVATCLLSGIGNNTTVAISGVEPYFNPFEYGEGHSLQVAFRNPTIRVLTRQDPEELRSAYCKLPESRRFIDFRSSSSGEITAVDLTATVDESCQKVAMTE